MRYLLALFVFTNPAWAACEDGEVKFMSCQIENSINVLRVCYDEQAVHYRFGATGQTPDLALSSTIGAVDYTPWPGIGRSIWEEIRFENDGYRYAVHAGFERMFGDEEYEDVPHRGFGGVNVTRGADEVEVVTLDCDRASVDFGWDDTLFNAKTALGFVWDDRTRMWTANPD